MRVPRSIAAVAALAAFAVAGQAAAGQVVVRRGDTLSGVAARAGVSVRDLAGANGISDPNRIRAGQTLTIPGSGGSDGSGGSGGSAAVAAPKRHLIARGETLAAIAAKHGVSVATLADANGITNRHRIIAGTYLDVPAGGSPSAPASPAAPAAPTAAVATHTVRSGENLGAIARRYGTTIAAIVEANDIDDPNRVREGTKLKIPAGAGGTATPSGRLPAKLAADPARLALIPLFDRWAGEYGVPADLLKAMAWMESGWQNHVRSGVGAMGIGQIMPATVDFVCDRLLKQQLDPAVPEHNIRMSARYLRWLLDRADGSTSRALAGYYQGPASVRERGMFNQTRAYVEGVQALRERFAH